MKKGLNTVEVDVLIGSEGTGDMGILPASYCDREISCECAEQYDRMQKSFAAPEENVDFTLDGFAVCFRTSQAYPAGIEYRESGDAEWHSVWSSDFTENHRITLPADPGKTYEICFVQNAFLCGWTTKRSKTVTVIFP